MENEWIGNKIRLEPLELIHVEGLSLAAAGNQKLFQWTAVPQGIEALAEYVKSALEQRDAGTGLPFVIIGNEDGAIKGSTRFWNMTYWPWPSDTPEFGRTAPDVCEIGHTWLTASSIKTGINTEIKFLMLKYAFEYWKVWRVNFTTDVRNLQSRAAIERLGAKFEGLIRAERMGADFTIRDSARFSILLSEWTEVKARLQRYMESY
ncbi:N-acetyltransferase [Pedobacter sp. KBW06]|uniref:GNAT family N-acetyltransferase n=1 Tax=Pedobacter sp. KBW06 TaxID=2153359 RepID=UPI000F5A3F45|nr:GNAT family protein [Pedobacter sp. KBW06]RQO74388.1 N-acetyltransferase [Pedobacter sp. KBW06]